ncbi:MAG: hypothetical protein QW291_01220 [Thermofilaceae archaeon]
MQCTLCRSQPLGWVHGYLSGASTPIQIELGPGVEVTETASAQVTFTMNYGPITVTVKLWKEITRRTAYTPFIVISSIQWIGSTLYVFGADSGKKTIHFIWG